MILKKIAAPVQPHKLWKALLTPAGFCYSKISFKNNMERDGLYHSPLVGYYCLSSIIKTFTTSFTSIHENLKRSANSVETAIPDVEISNEHTLGYKHHTGYFYLWLMGIEAGFSVLCSPIEKLLFDILKNLVTFTASNHCMYGGKRYN